MLKGVFNKTLLQIFLALSIVICLMFASNYIIFQNSMKIMNEQTGENNKLVVRGVIQSFEESFKEVNDIIYTIGTLPYQIYDTQQHENINIPNAFLFIRNASELVSQNYVEDFVVFFKDSDLAITSRGTESFRSVFEKRYNNSRLAPEYWKNFAVTRHPQQIIPSSVYTEQLPVGEVYNRTLLAVVGNNQLARSGLNIVLFVNMEKLYSRVNQKSMMKGSSLIVLDQDRNPIVSTDGNYELDGLEGIMFNSGNETIFQKGGYEYHCVRSEYNGFVYINKVPNNYEDVISAMGVNKIVLLFTTIAGIIISLFLSLYLYSPVKKILELIGSTGEDTSRNHYSYIYNSIKKIQSENRLIKSRMDIMEEEVRRSVFFKMLDDITYYRNLKDQIDTYFKVIFYSKRFLMVSFDIHESEALESAADSPSKRTVPEEMAGAIQKALEERVEASVVFYMENMQFIALIGVQENTKRETILHHLQAITEELRQTIFEGYTVLVAVSRYYTEVQQCKEAFRDVKLCYAYRNIRTKKLVIDVEKIDYTYDLYMPLDFDEKLSNLIVRGNLQDAMGLINQVIDKNIEKDINYIKFENIISDIFNSIIKVLVFLGFDRSEIIAAEKEFSLKVNNVGNFEAIKKLFYGLVESATEQIHTGNPSKLNKDFILQYIHLHYAEDLYLDKISDVTGTTPKYFSNFFKRNFGVNYVEYLNKVRMSHAKELLKSTEIPVSEIGEKVGFTNSSTFASTFKKYCGISPTEYRKEYIS